MKYPPFFAVFFPVLTTLNISSSAIPLTFGRGTENLAAFSFRLFFYIEVSKRTPIRAIGDEEFDVLALLKAFAFVGFDLSRRYCGIGVLEGSVGVEDLTFRFSCALICFLI